MAQIRRRVATRLAAAALLAGAASSAFAPAAQAQAQAPQVLKIGIVGRNDTPEAVGIRAMADVVRERTDGRYRLELFASGALGGEREMLEGLTLGTVDIAYAATAVASNFVPDFQILDAPFLFRDFDHAQATLSGRIGEDLIQAARRRNLVVLAVGGLGFRQLTTKARPVSGVPDLRGLKIRTMENQIHLQAWRALGAMPTPMALPEVFMALQQGTVDGQENPITAIVGNRFGEVQKHLTLTNHIFTATVFAIAPAVWNRLPEADRQAFVEAAKVGKRTIKEEAERRQSSGLDQLRGMGVQVIETVDREAFVRALAPVYDDLGRRFGKERLDAIRNHP